MEPNVIDAIDAATRAGMWIGAGTGIAGWILGPAISRQLMKSKTINLIARIIARAFTRRLKKIQDAFLRLP